MLLMIWDNVLCKIHFPWTKINMFKKRNLSCWIGEKLGNIRTGTIKKNSKNKDHSIRKFVKIKDHIRTIGTKILGKYKDH